MTLFQFFIALGISAILLFLIRAYWKEIVIIGVVLYTLGQLLFWSLLSAILWAAFINSSADGWMLLWLYFFLIYGGIIIVYLLIAIDIFHLAGDLIKSIIKE
ncbi:MAG: hypothetical protein FJY17_01645 [Bacteroidetes bacterium]|nr:hypothetical protein [Bacteroidota bacterium]